MTTIDQFKESLAKTDLNDACTVLDSFNNESEKTRLEVLHLLALEDDHSAWHILNYMTGIDIEPGETRDRWIQLITDRAHLNFNFSTILYKTSDQKKIQEALPLIRHIMTKETDPGLLCEAIRAAGINQIHGLTKDVAEYIYFDDQVLKALAVAALERMGTSRSLAILEEAAATVKCDQTILDAVYYLKNKVESETHTRKTFQAREASTSARIIDPPIPISALNRELESKDVETRFRALGKLAELEEEVCLPLLMNNLKTGSHDLIINSLGLISRFTPEHLLGEIYSLFIKNKRETGILFAFYDAMGDYPHLESAAPILTILDHPATHLRLAAIRILNNNFTDFVAAEINSRIEAGTQKGKRLVEAILDAHAGTIIDALKMSDAFSYSASNYLTKHASTTCLDYYIFLLNRRGLKSTEKRYKDLLRKKNLSNKPVAMVVSSSETVLRVHEKNLFKAGYLPQSYQSAQDAFEKSSETKPDLILADLFLDTMHGLDFAHELREFYSSKDLPIILSTNQQDFSPATLEKRLIKEGIQNLLFFPGDLPWKI